MKPTLTLSLLGPFEATLDNLALTKFRTNKVQALLIYLAVEASARPSVRHRRERLMELLWPGLPLKSAQENLRQTLYQLRKAIPELPAKDSDDLAPFLLTDRQTVQLNPACRYALDVATFSGLLKGDMPTTDLEQAVALYRGDFLVDFYLPDSDEFDTWAANQRATLSRQALGILDKLTDIYIDHQAYDKAEAYARRQLELDNLQENAHRQLMTTLAQNGRRGQALAQYETLHQLLKDELGVEPSVETASLYEDIRAGEASQTSPPIPSVSLRPQPPAFFSMNRADPEKTVFVGRIRELAQLDRQLKLALTGQGQVTFITGGAGRGKTALLAEFSGRAQQVQPDLLVVGGNCNAYAGIGDPYLPFREAMELLTGEVEARWMVGAMTRDHARRLWQKMPATVQALVEHGPYLIDIFVPGKRLLARARAFAPGGADWLTQLRAAVERPQSASAGLEQSALFGQFTNVLRHLAERHPLVIMLDDLQWADEASISLLFHLGRRLAGSRILIVGAYRPDELASGPPATGSDLSETHPLTKVLDEFKRHYGDVWIDLAQADRVDGRAFIEAFLDSEPNRLDETFRQALFQQTGGHPLFTVELLREMQTQADLVRDESGHWEVGQTLNWETMPARVEAVIAQRLGRLDDRLRDILTVASVEGEIFTAEVVAGILGIDDRSLLQNLSQQLEKRHRLVRERGELEAGGRYLAQYQFGHALFQHYLYTQLSQNERRRWHGDVAGALAELYVDDPDAVAVQLAHHYTAARDWNQAVLYLNRAGDLARQRVSLPDATRHYQAALARWPHEDKTGRAQLLRKLGECLWMTGHLQKALQTFASGYVLFDEMGDLESAGAMQRLSGRVHWELGDREASLQHLHQALSLAEQCPESIELARVMGALSRMHMLAAEGDQTIAWGERALTLARQLNAEDVIVDVLNSVGALHMATGNIEVGQAMLQESLQRALGLGLPYDACRAYYNLAYIQTWFRCHYQEAKALLEDLKRYAQHVYVPLFVAYTHLWLTHLDWLTGQWDAALAARPIVLNQIGNFDTHSQLHIWSHVLSGRIDNDLGQADLACRELERHLPLIKNLDELQTSVSYLYQLARAYAALDQDAQANEIVQQLLDMIDHSDLFEASSIMALLFSCQWLATQPRSKMSYTAHNCLDRLERAHAQIGGSETAACLSEAQGYVFSADGDFAHAANQFQVAASQWQALNRPYDQIRALNGLGQALLQIDYKDEARQAYEQAMDLINTLAAQLEDTELKGSFRNSLLVKAIRRGQT